MSLVVVSSSRFLDHVTPAGHPERTARAEVLQRIAADCQARGARVLEPRPATDGELVRVHDADYVRSLDATAGRTVVLDPDTSTSPATSAVARLAAGAAVQAVDAVLDGPAGTRGLVLVRPPGHHAERNRAMGFCYFNNIAVAAAHARARGLSRVAIVDYDVHHGNGTQAAFYDDASVLFVSSHQFPFYPGTGAARDTGRGHGAGYTVNVPLSAGAVDADIEHAFEAVVLPVIDQFRPELVLISAGFDAHADDPLGGLQWTAEQFGRLTAYLVAAASAHAKERVVAITEGGYDLAALKACGTAVARVLSGESDLDAFERPRGPAPRGEASVAAVRTELRQFWRL